MKYIVAIIMWIESHSIEPVRDGIKIPKHYTGLNR